MSVNKVILIGNTCQDPKVTTFPEGGKVAQFPLATNKPARKKQDGTEVPEQTEFHNVVINKTSLAEVAEKFVKKGNKLYIEGEIRTRKYVANDNIERYITEIYAYNMELLTPKAQGAPPPPPLDPIEQIGQSNAPF